MRNQLISARFSMKEKRQPGLRASRALVWLKRREILSWELRELLSQDGDPKSSSPLSKQLG